MAADEPSDFDLLARFLTAPVQQFALVLAVADDQATLDATRQHAAAVVSDAGLRLAAVDIEPGRPILEQLAAAIAPGADVLFVDKLERVLFDRLGAPVVSAEIERLNWDRDRLAATLSTRTVCWLLRAAAESLADAARDLNDVVMSRYRFEANVAPDPLVINKLPPAPDLAAASDEHIASTRNLLSRLTPRSAGWADASIDLARRVRGSNPGAAAQLLREAFAWHRSNGNDMGSGRALVELARLESRRGDYAGAEHFLAQALDIAHASNNERLRVAALALEADIRMDLHDYAAALRIRSDARHTYEKLGDRWGLAETERQIGSALVALGRSGDAQPHLDAALAIFREIGDEYGVAVSMLTSADAATTLRNLPAALDATRGAIRALASLGDARGTAIAKGKLADLLFVRGDVELAARLLLDEVLPTLRATDGGTTLATALAAATRAVAKRGGPGDAELYAELQAEAQLLSKRGIATRTWTAAT